MTGSKDGDGVLPQGLADGTRPLWSTNSVSDPPVGSHFSKGDLRQRRPDFLLERCTNAGKGNGEVVARARKVFVKLERCDGDKLRVTAVVQHAWRLTG